MTDARTFRRLALAIDGASEAPHFDRTAFRIDRIFATLPRDGQTANLKFAQDEQELKCLTAPAAFSPVPNAWGRQGWTTVVFSRLSTHELREALEMAAAHAVGKPRRRHR
ncbi:MAG: MmcQ/YjbR family DNA-binding protein [Hyphomicrobiaceae bacterium]